MTEFLISPRHPVNAAVLVCSLLVSFSYGITQAAATSVEHRLEITLVPQEQKLIGRDLMHIRAEDQIELLFHLSARAEVLQVSVNGIQKPFHFSASDLIVPLDAHERREGIDVDIRYQSIFDDPLPMDPVNTDNPGYGVTASISKKGVFLLSGAGWYGDRTLLVGQRRIRGL